MTKRYREPVSVEERSEEPAAFRWRGARTAWWRCWATGARTRATGRGRRRGPPARPVARRGRPPGGAGRRGPPRRGVRAGPRGGRLAPGPRLGLTPAPRAPGRRGTWHDRAAAGTCHDQAAARRASRRAGRRRGGRRWRRSRRRRGGGPRSGGPCGWPWRGGRPRRPPPPSPGARRRRPCRPPRWRARGRGGQQRRPPQPGRQQRQRADSQAGPVEHGHDRRREDLRPHPRHLSPDGQGPHAPRGRRRRPRPPAPPGPPPPGRAPGRPPRAPPPPRRYPRPRRRRPRPAARRPESLLRPRTEGVTVSVTDSPQGLHSDRRPATAASATIAADTGVTAGPCRWAARRSAGGSPAAPGPPTRAAGGSRTR